MRPRKQKNLYERLADCRDLLWEVPGTQPIGGSRYYTDIPRPRPEDGLPVLPFTHLERPLWVEIGCGKGQMLRQLAQRHTEWNFLGLEREPKVLLTALERASGRGVAAYTPQAGKSGVYLPPPERPLENLRFVMADADALPFLLAQDSVTGFYVTFSDPWPKNRHANRRLTHRSRLDIYQRLLRQGGEVRFKSDNEGLFRFSLAEFQAALPPYFVTENLHDSSLANENVMTEYELFFSRKGQPIYAIYAKKTSGMGSEKE